MRRRRRRRRSRRRALRPVRPPSRGRVPGTRGRRAGARRRPGFRAAPPGRRRGRLPALRLRQDGPPGEASPPRQHVPPLPVVRPYLQPRRPAPPRDPTRRGLTGRGPLRDYQPSRPDYVQLVGADPCGCPDVAVSGDHEGRPYMVTQRSPGARRDRALKRPVAVLPSIPSDFSTRVRTPRHATPNVTLRPQPKGLVGRGIPDGPPRAHPPPGSSLRSERHGGARSAPVIKSEQLRPRRRWGRGLVL